MSPISLLGRVAFPTMVCLSLAAPAHAQIYSWHDANGNLVLSDRKSMDKAANMAPEGSYPVARADAVRATRFVPADRARAYDDFISEHARLNSVREGLVRAVIQVESAFNPSAVSPKGAIGLMQLMPATIEQFHVRNAFNASENIRGGVAYLRQLLDRYDNNEQLALAAYNAGPGAVDRHGSTVPPYRETVQYVARVTELAGVHTATGAKMYRIVQVVNGKEIVLYSNNPDARVNPAALSPADPADRTPDPAPRSASVVLLP